MLYDSKDIKQTKIYKNKEAKKMKKTVGIVLIGIIGILLTGCVNITPKEEVKPQGNANQSGQEEVQPPVNNNQNTAPVTNGAVALTLEEAKAIALKNAGVSEADVWGLKVEEGTENQRKVYEIEFTFNNNEYDYDIDVTTGEIVKNKVEPAN